VFFEDLRWRKDKAIDDADAIDAIDALLAR